MPLHDWRRVDAGTFHAFHNAWNTHLMGQLNSGILPNGYYALAEQHVRGRVPNALALQYPDLEQSADPGTAGGNRGIALADSPPRVRHKLVADAQAAYRAGQRTLTIRRTSGHHVVALLEIVSPANKDRPSSVKDFVDKVDATLIRGIHVLVVDLFPPGRHDRQGMHGEIWSRFGSEEHDLPVEQPLTLSSYLSGDEVEAYVEHLAFADSLAEMPLFLDPETYVNVPLEATYEAAIRDMPAFWREVLAGTRQTVDWLI